jgi:3-methyladenine DNA glycosylase/8-oxoguanine DNA glycosylase
VATAAVRAAEPAAAPRGGEAAPPRRGAAAVRAAQPAAAPHRGPSVVELDVIPPGPYRLPPPGRDGVMRRRDGALVRVLHCPEDREARVCAWIANGAVRLRAEAPTRECALYAVDRMRFALGLDHDIRPFLRRFRWDPLIGPIVRRRPWIRPLRRPEPFEALAWAITEQLIESERASAIQRVLVRRFGRRSDCGTLRDAPSAARLARCGQAELQACDLSAGRSQALIRVSREVAAGRVDLSEHEPTWRRLRTIREIGPWTLECLALHGQGRDDQIPAGDLAYVKLVGNLAGLGRRATVDEVYEFFEPYAPYAALAGQYMLNASYLKGPAAGTPTSRSRSWPPRRGPSPRSSGR